MDTIYISLNTGIAGNSAGKFISIISNLIQERNPKRLYFMISSPGGSVDDGVAIYNFLLSLPVDITMHNIGTIDSIATVIYSAGKNRIANLHTTFLFHGVTFDFNGQNRFNLSMIEEMKSRLVENHESIANIIADRSKFHKEEILEYFSIGSTISSELARSKSFVHKIEQLNLPPGSPIFTIDFN